MKPKPLTDKDKIEYWLNNYQQYCIDEDCGDIVTVDGVLAAVEGLKREDMFTLGDFDKAIDKWFPVAKEKWGRG